mgnify:CR=1 FL=1
MTKTKKKKTVATQVIDARSVGTPLIAIETPDPSATNSELLETVKQTCAKAHVPVPPILLWDAASFLRALNEPALPVVDKLLEDFGGDPSAVGDPSQALALFNKTPEGTMIIMANVHRYWEGDHPDNRVIQHIFNLRNVFKSSGRTLIFTVPDCTLPSELKHDVMVLTAKLPTTEELKPMVIGMHDSAGWPKPSAEEVSVAVSALSGLAHQQAEQTIAMAIVDGKKEEKLNRDTLRMQQRQMIEQTEGLSIYQGSETFADLRGMDGLLGFCGKVIDGKNKPLAVVFVDEIEKMMAGALGGGSDTSGVSQEQCGYLLQHMQDTEAKGIMLLGLGGTGKSSVAKAFGNEAGCLTLGLDLGAMKGSLVATCVKRLNARTLFHKAGHFSLQQATTLMQCHLSCVVGLITALGTLIRLLMMLCVRCYSYMENVIK